MNHPVIKELIYYAVVLAFLIAVLWVFSESECHKKAAMQGLICEYSFIGGCMVQINGHWVDYEKWRITQ